MASHGGQRVAVVDPTSLGGPVHVLRRLLSVVVASALDGLITGGGAAPASAVTFGSNVVRPSATVPWAVSVYWSPDAGTAPQFICSGTALSAREVMTAAHCVQERGFYYVKIGADVLSRGRLVPLEAVRENPGYGARQLVNDVAIVRPLYGLGLRSYPRLASAALAAAIRSRRPPALTLYGWGTNQNGRLTGNLLAARLVPQTRAAQSAFGASFRPALMLAAGRFVATTNTYSGACSGDSGGPLVVTSHGVPYVVGVTSFGSARGCSVKVPTVFTSVGNYSTWIASARRSLPTLAATDNQALPVLESPASISGTVSLGSTLTCSPGRWSRNTRSLRPAWSRTDGSGSGTVAAGSTYQVTAADAGSRLTCTVTARSDAGARSTRAVVDAAAAPSSYAGASITGLSSYSSAAEARGATVTCGVPAYTQPGVTTSVDWYADVYGARTPLATGPSLTLTDDLVRKVAGTFLGCSAVSSNAMGSETKTDEILVGGLRPPSIYASISYDVGYQAAAGATATCGVGAAGDANVSYRWAAEPSYTIDHLSGSAQLLGTGPTYAVTSDAMALLGGRYLACEATATTWQGSDTTAASDYVAAS